MKFRLLFGTVVLASLLTISCDKEDNDPTDTPDPVMVDDENILGVRSAKTKDPASSVYATLRQTVDQNPNLKIVSEIDHSDNAASAQMNLPFSRVLIFGNPEIGSKLMQENILTGLDLPQRILVSEQDTITKVYYNDVGFLSNRYQLAESDALDQMGASLQSIVEEVASTPEMTTEEKTSADEGIITVVSSNSHTMTFDSILAAIESNNNLKIMAQVDHQENASNVNIAMDSSKLIVVGNPNLGSPLMLKKQSLGLDLPQKILIYRDSEMVKVSYNDPKFIASKFSLEGSEDELNTIADALEAIVKKGTE